MEELIEKLRIIFAEADRRKNARRAGILVEGTLRDKVAELNGKTASVLGAEFASVSTSKFSSVSTAEFSNISATTELTNADTSVNLRLDLSTNLSDLNERCG